MSLKYKRCWWEYKRANQSVIEDNFDRPFVWGEWDCTIFASMLYRSDGYHPWNMVMPKALQMVEDLGGHDAKVSLAGLEFQSII